MIDIDPQNTYNLKDSYGQKRIILVARDPNCLFAYWDIPSEVINRFIKDIGEEIWKKSYPALKVKDIYKNYSYYINIDDNANNWYITVENANSLYEVEYGRRISPEFFVTIALSNFAITPSNTISTNTQNYFVDYRTMENCENNYASDKIYDMFNNDSYYRNMGVSSMDFMPSGIPKK